MDIWHGLTVSLTSPMVLAFALGVLAILIRSDLKFPEGVYATLTIYLLFAIGIKGGVKLVGWISGSSGGRGWPRWGCVS